MASVIRVVKNLHLQTTRENALLLQNAKDKRAFCIDLLEIDEEDPLIDIYVANMQQRLISLL